MSGVQVPIYGSRFGIQTGIRVDESGSDKRTSIRKFGYALRGEPAVYHRLLVQGKRVSAIAAISSDGLVDVELTTGSVNSDKFLDFVRGSLIPNMMPFDGCNSKSILILDNCSIHHVEAVTKVLNDAGILATTI